MIDSDEGKMVILLLLLLLFYKEDTISFSSI